MTSLTSLSLLLLWPALVALPKANESANQWSPNHSAVGASAAAARQDTTFKPTGTYQLDLAVGGQPISMMFTVEKKSDGALSGVFKSEALGEIPTTSFRLEGRKMLIEVLTDGGPASVTLSVNKENAVEGEWTMQGDGSKISGKKAG